MPKSLYLQVHFSQNQTLTQKNQYRLLYGYLINPNEFIDDLHNDIANKIHTYYREKQVLNTIICLSEGELIAGSLDNFNLYYQMS